VPQIARRKGIFQSRSLKAAALFLLASGLSAWMVEAFARSPGGYAADYAAAGALVFAGMFVLTGLALLISRKTRWLAMVCLVAAGWLQETFQGGIKLCYRLGLVAWANDRKIDLLADDGPGYYIYFQAGVSEEAIARFNKETLQSPSSSRGEELREEIRTFARMPPVDGREVVRIVLQPSLTRANIVGLIASIKKQPVVFEISDHPSPPSSERLAR
jgi:hypothetical protein